MRKRAAEANENKTYQSTDRVTVLGLCSTSSKTESSESAQIA
jgi:hypothetical protein